MWTSTNTYNMKTEGQRRIRPEFSPSRVKDLAVELMYLIADIKAPDEVGDEEYADFQREKATAKTYLEIAAMFAVKASTHGRK